MSTKRYLVIVLYTVAFLFFFNSIFEINSNFEWLATILLTALFVEKFIVEGE